MKWLFFISNLKIWILKLSYSTPRPFWSTDRRPVLVLLKDSSWLGKWVWKLRLSFLASLAERFSPSWLLLMSMFTMCFSLFWIQKNDGYYFLWKVVSLENPLNINSPNTSSISSPAGTKMGQLLIEHGYLFPTSFSFPRKVQNILDAYWKQLKRDRFIIRTTSLIKALNIALIIWMKPSSEQSTTKWKSSTILIL